jgi:hypothetical protein
MNKEKTDIERFTLLAEVFFKKIGDLKGEKVLTGPERFKVNNNFLKKHGFYEGPETTQAEKDLTLTKYVVHVGRTLWVLKELVEGRSLDEVKAEVNQGPVLSLDEQLKETVFIGLDRALSQRGKRGKPEPELESGLRGRIVRNLRKEDSRKVAVIDFRSGRKWESAG